MTSELNFVSYACKCLIMSEAAQSTVDGPCAFYWLAARIVFRRLALLQQRRQRHFNFQKSASRKHEIMRTQTLRAHFAFPLGFGDATYFFTIRFLCRVSLSLTRSLFTMLAEGSIMKTRSPPHSLSTAQRGVFGRVQHKIKVYLCHSTSYIEVGWCRSRYTLILLCMCRGNKKQRAFLLWRYELDGFAFKHTRSPNGWLCALSWSV